MIALRVANKTIKHPFPGRKIGDRHTLLYVSIYSMTILTAAVADAAVAAVAAAVEIAANCQVPST